MEKFDYPIERADGFNFISSFYTSLIYDKILISTATMINTAINTGHIFLTVFAAFSGFSSMKKNGKPNMDLIRIKMNGKNNP